MEKRNVFYGNIQHFYRKIYSICLRLKDKSMNSAGLKLASFAPAAYWWGFMTVCIRGSTWNANIGQCLTSEETSAFLCDWEREGRQGWAWPLRP